MTDTESSILTKIIYILSIKFHNDKTFYQQKKPIIPSFTSAWMTVQVSKQLDLGVLRYTYVVFGKQNLNAFLRLTQYKSL